MGIDRLDLFLLHARQNHQVKVNGQKVLGHDMRARIGQQVVNIGNTACQRILDWNHGEIDFALFQRDKHVLERVVRHGFHLGEHVADRDL